jgi:antirestriction protein ArdC
VQFRTQRSSALLGLDKIMRKRKYDVRQEITDKIINLIEEGVSPWQCPWVKKGCQLNGLPFNWQTKAQYNGINILLLWIAAMENGFTRSAFMTFKQAQAMGGKVKKGAKGTRCIFFKPLERDLENTESGETEKVVIPVINTFTVFNVDQIEGLDLPDVESENQEYHERDVVAKIDILSEIYCNNTGLVIKNGGDRAYYSPSLDIIRLPTTFVDGYKYAAVKSHELIHSTGIPSRLDRFSRQDEDFNSVKESYAAEELTAELGAAFLCSHLGIECDYPDHASYLDHYLKHLKDDKNFIFRAAAQAAKATDFIVQGGINQLAVA